jgi:hypothetical protein
MKKFIITEEEKKHIIGLYEENKELPNPVGDFIIFMETFYNMLRFGQGDFKQIPNNISDYAKNITTVVNGRKMNIQGSQVYRGKLFKPILKEEPYAYIWLDNRELTTNPSVHMSFKGTYKKFNLKTQMEEFKKFVTDNVTTFN